MVYVELFMTDIVHVEGEFRLFKSKNSVIVSLLLLLGSQVAVMKNTSTIRKREKNLYLCFILDAIAV
ncbi:MAG: hypothetical protein A2W19_15625 [Spirochaetes bacterium RBG_16_49_21]|nr:MAG: hypothetical protein A2W19_15625 [Spirochaetes bacterium RBG_16_49_21]